LLSDSAIETPRTTRHVRHVYHIYAIRTRHRAALQQRLRARGIETGIHYPIPVHLQEAYAELARGPGSFPHSEQAAAEVLSLPMFSELTQAQLENVAAAVREEARG
jgi:dTDP-4-amino-4,6-dideoxygalactose transaminase